MSQKYNDALEKTYAIERKKKCELIFRYKTRAKIAMDSVISFLGLSNPKVIDFGSSEGLTLIEASRLLPEADFTGVEYSQELLSHQPNLPKNVSLLRGDISALPDSISSEAYDVVTALAVLEHLPEPGQAINEAKRVLKSGGILIATCPNPFWDDLAVKFGLLKDEQHESEMDQKSFKSLFVSDDLEILEFRRFMFAPIAVLPYLGIPFPPRLSLVIDRFIYALRIFNWGFVNQIIIVKKK